MTSAILKVWIKRTSNILTPLELNYQQTLASSPQTPQLFFRTPKTFSPRLLELSTCCTAHEPKNNPSAGFLSPPLKFCWITVCSPSAYMIGQQAGRESGCSECGSQGQSGPSERESAWWGVSDCCDSSGIGGSLQTKHHRRSISTTLNCNIFNGVWQKTSSCDFWCSFVNM